jgi:hypothetical protein
MNKDCWIPSIESLEKYDGNWENYETALYDIFTNDFLSSHPYYNSKPVYIKKYPFENNKEAAFYHLTHKDFNHDSERLPDLRRSERLNWIRPFIEHSTCNKDTCDNCDGVKKWNEPYKNKTRIHILLPEQRYTVILEERKNYYLLITAFYIEHDHQLNKQLKKYEQYKSDNPSIDNI